MADGERSAGPRAVIDLAALRANARVASERAGDREWIAVVKADGYGHGVVRVARELLATGSDRLAVVTAEEATELREAGLAAPVLVLGGPRDAREADEIIAARTTAVLHHEEGARLMAEADSAICCNCGSLNDVFDIEFTDDIIAAMAALTGDDAAKTKEDLEHTANAIRSHSQTERESGPRRKV